VFAVQGAIRKTSAHSPYATWLFHEPVSLFQNSIPTGFLDKVEITKGLTKSFESGVMIQRTSHPSLMNLRINKGIL
jgi:hypothetical protein